MELYVFPPSINARKVLLVVEHTGIEVELRFIDLRGGEQNEPWYLALNPNGQMPTLVDDEFVLWESNAVMHYLAASSGSTLWPDGAQEQADVLRWMDWQGTTLVQIITPIMRSRLQLVGDGKTVRIQRIDPAGPRAEALGPVNDGDLEEAQAMFGRAARLLDAHLESKRHVAAGILTIADLALAATLSYHTEAQLPIADFGNLERWIGEIESLPAWQQAMSIEL